MDNQTTPKGLVPWIAYLIFFSVLNETMFNVSTPKIAEQFHLNASGVSWVMTIFLVFFGIGSVIFGKLSDIYSVRKLIVIGVWVYVLGSVLGVLLQFSYSLVVLSRAIQGIGASAIPPLVFVVIARFVPEWERGKTFGFITSVVSVGIGIGPIIGGFISSAAHWSYLFLVPIFSLAALAPLQKILPDEPRKPGSIDLLGALWVALTVGALVLALNVGGALYYGLFVLFLLLFIWRIRTASEPFVKPSVFLNTKFRTGMIVGFSLFSVVIGSFFLIPLMLNKVYGLDSSQIGLILFPGAISSFFFGPIAGNLADRRGNNFVVRLGLGLLAGSLFLLALLNGVSWLLVGAAMLLNYVGFTLFQTALINGVSQVLPSSDNGIGMGFFNLVSIVSGAVGTALVGKLLDSGAFGFTLLPSLGQHTDATFSNIFLVFALVVVAAGALYLNQYRQTKPQPVGVNH